MISNKRQHGMVDGGTANIQEVFTKIVQAHKMQESHIELDGDKIKASSQRYELFRTKGIKCVHCDLVGQYFRKERHVNDLTYHLNLYAIDSEGDEVLMTKDHIIPKAEGGRNFMKNYQPMCKPCNEEKGSMIL